MNNELKNIDMWSLKQHWKKRICKLESKIIHNAIALDQDINLLKLHQIADKYQITL